MKIYWQICRELPGNPELLVMVTCDSADSVAACVRAFIGCNDQLLTQLIIRRTVIAC